MNGIDPSLLQDFLTESTELVDRLDADLVKLEAADKLEQQELLNGCFRALHTIKGAAGFLGLETVINFSHIAEDALNRMRKGEIQVSAHVMDLLLQSADVVRSMIEDLSEGQAPAEAPDDLIEQLKAIIQNNNQDEEQSGQSFADAAAADLPGEALQIGTQKLDLLEYMVADLKDYSSQFDEVVNQLRNDGTRSDAANHLVEIADNMVKTADFFELDDLTEAIKLLLDVAPKLKDVHEKLLDEIIIRIQATKWLIDQQADWLSHKRVLRWPLTKLSRRLRKLADGHNIDTSIIGAHGGDVQKLLVLDCVISESDVQVQSQQEKSAAAVEPATPDNAPQAANSTESATTQAGVEEKGTGKSSVAEQTIRVEVSRLEALLNLVGQLVLNKNRILGLTRGIRDTGLPQEIAEGYASAANDLDLLMSELQIGVMRTRMQPLAKLFDRYPRVIRDMARMTNKQIHLNITGKETEVDKSVIELLADPLVHLLRNSADHGIESPENRTADGKSEIGTISLVAEHQGSHVRVAVMDDGKGLDREVLGKKAVEKGLTTPEQLAQMDDDAVFRFIFHAGFSTAEKVSDLSGRGVGMDVVNTNISKMNGTINVSSKNGQGTTIEILIPLTVAIMPAMVVGVGSNLYCIPLQSILEIVKPDNDVVYSIKGHKVMRLRDIVLPLVNLQQRLNETEIEQGGKFAVVVAAGAQRLGLVVDKLVGQQDIVIKPLDDQSTKGGPFSGATIQENGEVSLILDVLKLVRQSQGSTGLRKAA